MTVYVLSEAGCRGDKAAQAVYECFQDAVNDAIEEVENYPSACAICEPRSVLDPDPEACGMIIYDKSRSGKRFVVKPFDVNQKKS